jgi:hypothetical protein
MDTGNREEEHGAGDRGQPSGQETSVREAARAYAQRGWRVIPLRPREKTPVETGWQDTRYGLDDIDAKFGAHSNIGALTGGASTIEGGWLIDVDLDAPEAVRAARAFLPPTGLIHGRAGKPTSHYWYAVAGSIATRKFLDPAPVGGRGLERPAHRAEGLKPSDGGPAGPSGHCPCAPAIHGRDASPSATEEPLDM